jgi:integrase
MGSVRPRGPGRWILSFSLPSGERRRPTIRARTRADAERELRRREGDIAHGRPQFPQAETLTLRELLDLVTADYGNNERKSLAKVVHNVERLVAFFGDCRATLITSAVVAQYVGHRKATGVANATINRELAVLRRAFTLAADGLISKDHVPRLRLLREAAPRSGFFEQAQFEAVRRHLPAPLRPVVTFAYITGWRIRSEVLTLRWAQVDFAAETIRLDAGTTKNNEPRVFVMTPGLRAMLEEQKALTDALQRETERIVPWVFHRAGERIRSFRRVWLKACQAAGVPGRIPHDFRRTAVRNLERAGVSRSVAMKMVGHKTESIYRRYAIVSEGDLREAAKKLAAIEQGPWNGDASGSHRTHEPETVQNTPSPQHQVAGGPRRRSTDGSKR